MPQHFKDQLEYLAKSWRSWEFPGTQTSVNDHQLKLARKTYKDYNNNNNNYNNNNNDNNWSGVMMLPVNDNFISYVLLSLNNKEMNENLKKKDFWLTFH